MTISVRWTAIAFSPGLAGEHPFPTGIIGHAVARPSTHPRLHVQYCGVRKARPAFPGALKNSREISWLGPRSTFEGRAEQHRVLASSFPREAWANPFRALGISAIFSAASPIPDLLCSSAAQPGHAPVPHQLALLRRASSGMSSCAGGCCITRCGASGIGMNEGSKAIGPPSGSSPRPPERKGEARRRLSRRCQVAHGGVRTLSRRQMKWLLAVTPQPDMRGPNWAGSPGTTSGATHACLSRASPNAVSSCSYPRWDTSQCPSHTRSSQPLSTPSEARLQAASFVPAMRAGRSYDSHAPPRRVTSVKAPTAGARSVPREQGRLWSIECHELWGPPTRSPARPCAPSWGRLCCNGTPRRRPAWEALRWRFGRAVECPMRCARGGHATGSVV